MQYLSQRLASKPSPKRGRGERAGDPSPPQRERILDAVERLSAARGLAGATIEAIVKEAGVSSVTFYEFFDGKEECFAAAFERAVEETADELGDAVAGEGAEPIAGDGAGGGLSWPEQVATGLRALIATIGARPERARLCLVEAQTGGGPELARRFEATLDRVAAKLREGRALETAFAALPATHEEATAGALAWLLRERLERGGEEELARIYPELIDIALAPYLGEEPRSPAAAAAGDG